MKKACIISGFFLFSFCLLQCKNKSKLPPEQLVKDYFIAGIDSMDKSARYFKSLVTAPPYDSSKISEAFIALRNKYKTTELFAAYYTPETAKSLNGPPIESVDENDPHITEQPEGLQVIEALICDKESDKSELIRQTDILIGSLGRLKTLTQQQQFANPQIFDAIRDELFRTTSLGLSGFDAPLVQSSIMEVRTVYQSIDSVLSFYQNKDAASIIAYTRQTLQRAADYLLTNNNFITFNRLEFIQQFANPISGSLLTCAAELKVQLPGNNRPLKTTAKSLFDYAAYDADYYTAFSTHQSSPSKISLGQQLFYDPILSKNGSRSCASCHQPDKAFTDGVKTNSTFDRSNSLLRNTPTLVYAGLQPALFYDNRVKYLEDQARDVISNKDEMHGSLAEAAKTLSANAQYAAQFNTAFAVEATPVNATNILNALASYIRSLRPFSSAFDKYMLGDSTKLNADQVKGFNLYMGKAKCGSCHFMPLFNGAIPPEFREIETEVLGVPVHPNSKTIDGDLGKYNLRKTDLYKYAFKIPTLRNIALTAPYMHNGAYSTLEQVMDFYNKGGGAGQGVQIDNQSLAPDPLNLTPEEIKQVIAFMKALTDEK
ncbi:cytochrome-c peroxidase [Pseudoflavitalea sp. G-6-1-2]|uniref:cytochrome-c peroxidase n=1 Tax=Pseudoflavitalea sp. G-6-1-2 TaxID=2728841 RepID=UPI00146D87C3|nr:cytochrome c peroxidase [Pseudoflavitalea sp. G-6-1-2]NML22403.1 cytochrome-c peroxidase [Pseudoflavitalea sp. G-6-1-2]